MTARDAGFSLIELVVVVAVLSVLAVGASLAAVSRDREPGDQRVFVQSFERSKAMAVSGRQTQGLLLTPQGVTRFHRVDGRWEPQGSERRWRGSVSVQAELGRQGARGPNVVMLANGDVSGFTIGFRPSRGPVTRCRHAAQTGLTCD